jgi:hypothetical protein
MDSTKLIFSFVKDRLLEPIQCYKDGDEFSDNKVKEEDNEGRLTRSSSLNDEDVQGEVRETPEKNVVEEVIAEGKSAEDDSIEERDSGSKKDISHNIVHRSIKISSKVVREMRRVPFDYKKIEKWRDNVNNENENKEENIENSRDPNEMKPVTPEERKDPNWLSNLPKNDDDEEN